MHEGSSTSARHGHPILHTGTQLRLHTPHLLCYMASKPSGATVYRCHHTCSAVPAGARWSCSAAGCRTPQPLAINPMLLNLWHIMDYCLAVFIRLYAARRDTLELFCRWLSDAVSEGQLRLLPDLLHALQHATCPDAAIAAVHTHLSQFFTHRTQVRELGIGAGAGMSQQGTPWLTRHAHTSISSPRTPPCDLAAVRWQSQRGRGLRRGRAWSPR